MHNDDTVPDIVVPLLMPSWYDMYYPRNTYLIDWFLDKFFVLVLRALRAVQNQGCGCCAEQAFTLGKVSGKFILSFVCWPLSLPGSRL